MFHRGRPEGRDVAELVFFSGTMDCGKSTLALQMDHNHRARGRGGVRFSRNDRAGGSRISSRLGWKPTPWRSLDGTDFWDEVMDRRTRGQRVDYLICDEAQFYSPVAGGTAGRRRGRDRRRCFCVRDHRGLPHQALSGIAAADRTRRPRPGPAGGGAVLVRTPRHPQRPHGRRRDGHRRRPGGGGRRGHGQGPRGCRHAKASTPVVGYETLCRRHFMRRVTAHGANIMAQQDQLLPFETDACLWRGSGGTAG